MAKNNNVVNLNGVKFNKSAHDNAVKAMEQFHNAEYVASKRQGAAIWAFCVALWHMYTGALSAISTDVAVKERVDAVKKITDALRIFIGDVSKRDDASFISRLIRIPTLQFVRGSKFEQMGIFTWVKDVPVITKKYLNMPYGSIFRIFDACSTADRKGIDITALVMLADASVKDGVTMHDVSKMVSDLDTSSNKKKKAADNKSTPIDKIAASISKLPDEFLKGEYVNVLIRKLRDKFGVDMYNREHGKIANEKPAKK